MMNRVIRVVAGTVATAVAVIGMVLGVGVVAQDAPPAQNVLAVRGCCS
jgi:threonine/homoserine/homoserine lactone efflux protein